MDVTAAQRAHRNLRRLPNYTALGGLAITSLAPQLKAQLDAGEQPIGLYENVPGTLEQVVLITDLGLHHNDNGSWRFVPYEEMVSADFEGGEKSITADHVALRLQGGETCLLPVRGGDPTIGTKDTFSMLMFLQAVIWDLHELRIGHPPHPVNLA